MILDKGKKKKERRTKHISTDNTGCYNVDGECTVVLHETKINLYESNSILNNSSVYCYAWFDLNLIIKKVILTNISHQSERLNATVRNE